MTTAVQDITDASAVMAIVATQVGALGLPAKAQGVIDQKIDCATTDMATARGNVVAGHRAHAVGDLNDATEDLAALADMIASGVESGNISDDDGRLIGESLATAGAKVADAVEKLTGGDS